LAVKTHFLFPANSGPVSEVGVFRFFGLQVFENRFKLTQRPREIMPESWSLVIGACYSPFARCWIKKMKLWPQWWPWIWSGIVD